MFIIYPSPIHKASKNLKNFSSIKTLVGIESQLSEWPSPILGKDFCNDVLETAETIIGFAKKSNIKTVVPLVEKVVLSCGLAVSKTGLRGNNLETATICTDRLSQRRALKKTGLNPRWQVYSTNERPFIGRKWLASRRSGPVVLKKPASARSEGVRIAYNGEDLEKFLNEKNFTRQTWRLRRVGFEPNYDFLIEEFIEGENWEVDGVSREKVSCVFRPLKQTWTKTGEKIVKYEAVTPPLGLVEAAIKAVEACGIKWSGWCVELKGSANNWKVIEVNARLGEDGGNFYNLLSPTIHPIEKLCQVLLY